MARSFLHLGTAFATSDGVAVVSADVNIVEFGMDQLYSSRVEGSKNQQAVRIRRYLRYIARRPITFYNMVCITVRCCFFKGLDLRCRFLIGQFQFFIFNSILLTFSIYFRGAGRFLLLGNRYACVCMF